jgi:hypothetical protein
MDNKAPDNQLVFLRERLKMNKEFFRRKSRRNRRRSVLVKVSIATLGAVITIVLGLKSTSVITLSSETAANVALMLGALVTILSVTEATFDFRWVWINYSMTLTLIYGLDDELEYLSAREGGASAEQLDSIFRRLQTTLADINDSWANRRLRDVAQSPEPAKTSPIGH